MMGAVSKACARVARDPARQSGTGRTLAIVLGTLALSGCSGSSLPKLPKVELPVAAHSEEPSEIYTRIARGAMACWFGTSGPLKQAYVFHADVAPPSANAGAEIVIHERDRTNPSPLGLRAYRVLIKRVPEGTAVAGENLKMPEPLGTTMTQDVQRWAADKIDCSPASPAPQGGLVTAVQNGAAPKATTPIATGTTKSR
jgi:hypothetical protein